MMDPYAALADAFLGHYGTIRGVVRYHLAAHQVDEHIIPPPARVVDVGGGAGQQTIRLARRGYEVVLLDPSQEMLARSRAQLSQLDPKARSRVRLVLGYGERGPALLGGETFDIVLCHGVLPYVDDPEPLADALVKLAAPGGMVSLIAKNAAALAMRSALEQRWTDAVRAMDAMADVGGVGVPTRGQRLERLVSMLEQRHCRVAAWYGIRVFTDHLGEQSPGPDLKDLLTAERLAGRAEPYRSVARLLHIIAWKTDQR